MHSALPFVIACKEVMYAKLYYKVIKVSNDATRKMLLSLRT